jgi:acyl-CoA thioester hydrolase
MTPSEPTGSRLIKRRLSIQPAFHQTDLMGVIHNSVHLLWFEDGRLQILFEILPLAEAMELGIALPVVENTCQYHAPVRFGDPLLLFTTHRIQPVYDGRLVFAHSLVHEKQKIEMASGMSAVTLIHHRTGQLVKDWPGAAWERYQALR